MIQPLLTPTSNPQIDFWKELDALVILFIKQYSFQIQDIVASKEFCLEIINNYYTSNCDCHKSDFFKRYEFYNNYKQNYHIAPSLIQEFIKDLVCYLRDLLLNESDAFQGIEIIDSLRKQSHIFKCYFDKLFVNHIVADGIIEEVFKQFKWEVRNKFTIPLFMNVLGYIRCTNTAKHLWFETHSWWDQEIVDNYDISFVMEIIAETNKYDTPISVEMLQYRLHESGKEIIDADTLREMLRLMRLTSNESDLYIWNIDALNLKWQIIRIFQEQRTPLNRSLILSYLNEKLPSSTGVTHTSKIRTFLCNHPEFTALGSTGYWILSEWEGENYVTGTVIGYITEMMNQEPEPVQLSEFAKKIAMPMDGITPKLVYERVSNRPDIFIKLVDTQADNQVVWTTLAKWQKIKDNGRYAVYTRKKLLRVRHLLNDALHNLIPKNSTLVISSVELTKKLAKACNASEITVSNYLRNLDNCTVVRDGCRYQYSIKYRSDKQYFTLPKRVTLKSRLEETISKILERNVWIRKQDLYNIVSEELKTKYHINLPLPTFYLYLSRMQGIQHKREGHQYLCSKI